MLTVKCPQCAAALKLRQAPPSGKVKCPKCSTVVAVSGGATAKAAPTRPAQAANPARRRAPAGPVDPDDANFDFGRIQFPSASGVVAVNQFPTAGNVSIYEGPIPGDPLGPETDESAKEAATKQATSTGKKKKKKSPMMLVGVLAGVAGLLILGIGAAVMFGGGEGGEGSSVDLLAAAQTTAPSGYRAVGIQGCVILMPEGSDWDELPSTVECLAIRSDASESVFFLGAMPGGSRELDKDQMRKKAERQLGGDILGGQPVERNGYKGIKGVLDGSLFLPRMMVEIYHVDERFCILGCAPLSHSADPSVKIDRKLEQAEQDIFYGSFKIGPKPSGWW